MRAAETLWVLPHNKNPYSFLFSLLVTLLDVKRICPDIHMGLWGLSTKAFYTRKSWIFFFMEEFI